MNFSVLLGLLLAGGVVVHVSSSSLSNSSIFLSPDAAEIVLGGTLAASLICFPLKHFFNLAKLFFRTMVGKQREITLDTINEIVRLSQLLRNGRPLRGEIAGVRNPFLRESLELLEDSGLTPDDMDAVLQTRVELQNERYKRDGFTFKIIGKFPPAFGLVGTTMGMIGLLQSVGQSNAFEKLGPSMSVALVATFYGLILANFFLIPIGENLGQASEDDLIMRRIVIEGIRLLRDQKHPILVHEHLKSYLSPTERGKIKMGREAA